jgi:hypothetical protein
MAVHLLFCSGTVADNVLNPGLIGLSVVAGAKTLAGIAELSGSGFESVWSDGEFLCLQEPSASEYLRQMDVEWTPHPTYDESRREYDCIWPQIVDHRIESIAELPRMQDRRPIDCEPVFTGTTSAPEQMKSMTLGQSASREVYW